MEIINIVYLLISVAIGGVIVEIFKPTNSKNIQLLLIFSGAYLFAVSVIHLIPELFHHHPKNSIGIFILLGFLIQILLEFFSKGIEHGHFHKQKIIPFSVMLTLCLHALIEGVPLGGELVHNHSAHNALLTGILLHKAPVSIVLLSLFLQSGMSRTRAYFFLFIFALMTPLGVYSGHLFSQMAIYSNEIMAIVIGIFLHISTTILFESSEDHKFSLYKISAIIVGAIFAIFSI